MRHGSFRLQQIAMRDRCSIQYCCIFTATLLCILVPKLKQNCCILAPMLQQHCASVRIFFAAKFVRKFSVLHGYNANVLFRGITPLFIICGPRAVLCATIGLTRVNFVSSFFLRAGVRVRTHEADGNL